MSILYESSCTQDCNQGRSCTCAPANEAVPMRGIVNGLLLVIPFWLVVALACWWLA